MPRLIRHDAVGPIELPPQEKSAWVCACGLSQDMPLRDGSHSICRKAEEDGKLYVYDKARKNVVEVREDK
jgi:CDGSH-type Zn-finger protein